MKAKVQKLSLLAERLQGLSPQQRYVFALTGHVFNELMLLMKWAHVSRRPPGKPRPAEDAAVGISMFLLRILSAKVHEALDVLSKNSVGEILRADYFGKVQGLTDQWDAALKQHQDLEWISWIRNKGGFHYMNAAQWGPHLTDELCDGAYVWIGARYGDTYFHWAEMAASLPVMRHVNDAEPFEGLAQMLSQLGELLSVVTSCLARGLQAFLNATGVGGALDDPICFDAPAFEPPALYYFFADERIDAK